MYEVGSFFIPNNNNTTFMEVSPDGIIKCANNCANCQNRIAFPIGTMPFEIKCPYTPINDKKLLPVQYHPPQYNCCQTVKPNGSNENRNNSVCIMFARIIGHFTFGVLRNNEEVCLEFGLGTLCRCQYH